MRNTLLFSALIWLSKSTAVLAYSSPLSVTNSSSCKSFAAAADSGLVLRARVYLAAAGGSIETADDGRRLMRDDLRSGPYSTESLIPADDPYTYSTANFDITDRFTAAGPGLLPEFRTITDYETVMSVTGQDAIVDWVFVELRAASDSTEVVATRSGLLQRDTDIVDLDGVSGLEFPEVPAVDYYVVVRHRNHLGAMSKEALAPEILEDLVDFTSPSFQTWDYGTTYPMIDYTGLSQSSSHYYNRPALHAGNINADDRLKYDSPNDDQSGIVFAVLSHPDNEDGTLNFSDCIGYYQADINMNGQVKYDNPNDDKNFLFLFVLLYPLNDDFLSNHNLMIEQIPPAN